jgi:hypothetical protein
VDLANRAAWDALGMGMSQIVENTKPTVCHHVGSYKVALWVVESRIWKALRHLLITPRNLQENHSHWWAVHNSNIGRSWKLQQVNFMEKCRSSIGAASYRALVSICVVLNCHGSVQ